MEYVGKLGSLFTSVQSFYNEINPATLSGAIDIVVVEQQDGELACSPFHVRFGKLSLLMPQEKKVQIKVNGKTVPFLMKVGEAGESFFVFETEHEVPEEFQTSPIMGAVPESKSDEDPPYLDLGAPKDQSLDQDASSSLSGEGADHFDDETEEPAGGKLHLPAELQSPKMIIEEQMDKVVTKIDPYKMGEANAMDPQDAKEALDSLQKATEDISLHHAYDPETAPQNDVYPMDDGSTLLERVIPEAITTTTVAKETFIVRPANGDIYSTWMDVTHTSVHERGGQIDSKTDTHSQQDESSHAHAPTPHHNHNHNHNHNHAHGRGETESIVLDIAGYKTEDGRWEDAKRALHEEAEPIAITTPPTEVDPFVASPTPISPPPLTEPATSSATTPAPAPAPAPAAVDNALLTDIDTPKEKAAPKSSWGWGSVRRQPTNDTLESSADETASTSVTDTPAILPSETVVKDTAKTTKDNKVQLEPGTTYRIEMSLCGLSAFGSDETENATVFEEHQITYDKFMHNPNVLNKPSLVFRYEKRYYAAGRTGPLFTSLLLFRKPLEGASHPDAGNDEASTNVSDSRESYLFGKGWRQWLSRSSVAAPAVEDKHPEESKEEEDESGGSGSGGGISNGNSNSGGETTTFTTTTMTTSVGWSAEHNSHASDGNTKPFPALPQKNYAKTLRLTSEQLKSLGLSKGVNTISFSVSSAYQGTATCAAKIFYWDHDIQIVISDIDGTITKSDTLGHVFTMIGKDWTHNGVAKLYTDIHNNGYYFLYLTSRAIGQADYTRDYLKKVSQGKYQLPDGPVIMSPDRLFTSLHREVIMRKPEVFKMACLRDIQRLFGGREPFNAGFGNRITDAMSYRSVDVPTSRIFTIDPYGDVKLELLTGFKSSYFHLNDLVDQIFPPINNVVDEAFNDWHFWKAPLPTVDLPEPDHPPTPTSPKPKPIVPDPSALPKESVVSSDKPQRSILRSFTSRNSTSDAPRKPAKVLASASTPTLLSRTSDADLRPALASGRRGSSSTDKSGTSSVGSDSGEKGASPSAPAPVAPTTSSSSSSSSIMNKMISGSLGGVRSTLSRTFSLSTDDNVTTAKQSKLDTLPNTIVTPPKEANTAQPEEDEDEDEDEEEDEEEEEEFDPNLDDIEDDIDMDSIPFI